MTFPIPRLSAGQYAELAPVLVKSLAGDDYAAYCKNLGDYLKNLEAKGVRPLYVDVDSVAVKNWLKARPVHFATITDLSQYAATVADAHRKRPAGGAK